MAESTTKLLCAIVTLGHIALALLLQTGPCDTLYQGIESAHPTPGNSSFFYSQTFQDSFSEEPVYPVLDPAVFCLALELNDEEAAVTR